MHVFSRNLQRLVGVHRSLNILHDSCLLPFRSPIDPPRKRVALLPGCQRLIRCIICCRTPECLQEALSLEGAIHPLLADIHIGLFKGMHPRSQPDAFTPKTWCGPLLALSTAAATAPAAWSHRLTLFRRLRCCYPQV